MLALPRTALLMAPLVLLGNTAVYGTCYTYSPTKHHSPMKHYAAYSTGWTNAKCVTASNGCCNSQQQQHCHNHSSSISSTASSSSCVTCSMLLLPVQPCLPAPLPLASTVLLVSLPPLTALLSPFAPLPARAERSCGSGYSTAGVC